MYVYGEKGGIFTYYVCVYTKYIYICVCVLIYRYVIYRVHVERIQSTLCICELHICEFNQPQTENIWGKTKLEFTT